MASVYIAPLVTKPTIITEPGQYRTRGGEIVTVETVSVRPDFGCTGHYEHGTRERWHKSGRIFAGMESQHDIVERVS